MKLGAIEWDYSTGQYYSTDPTDASEAFQLSQINSSLANLPSTPTITEAAASGNWSWLTDLINAAPDAIPKILTGLNAYEISQINLERARRNQPPINPAVYGPQVNVGLSAQTTQMLMWGAAGLAVLFFVSRARR